MAHDDSPHPRASVLTWQDKVSAAYFPLMTRSRDTVAFRGDLAIWPFGLVSATRIDCDAVLYRRTPSHLHDEKESFFLISVPGTAEVTFCQNDRQAQCRPGGFVIERSDAPYEYWHDTADVQWVVKVPRASVRARLGPSERFLGLSVDARTGMASYFLSSLSAAITHAEGLDGKARDLIGDHLIDVLCLALRGDERALDSSESATRLAHLQRAEVFIGHNLKNPALSPAMVAQACGISVRYLQHLFAGAGQTVGGHIRDARLLRCHEELCRHDRLETITTIAYRWGFADQTQFSRHYRTKFGCTPRETRQSAGGSPGR